MDMNRRGTMQNGGERSPPTINVGISGSELIATVMRRVRLAQASGNPRKALQTGLQHLEQRSLISGEERQSLSRMCDFAMIASAGGKRGVAAAERLRRLHDVMVLTSSGPIAVAVAGAVLQHTTSNEGGVSTQKLGQNPAAGFLGAVIIGGVIGGLAGGPGGALIGVIGGAVGALTDCSNP
jgi:hypothetical protein